MRFRIRKRDDVLGLLAAFFLFAGSMNALEYFLAGKNYLSLYDGVVESVSHKQFESTSRRRQVLYSRTTIRLKGISRNFSLTENAMYGGNIPVQEGDSIRIYARRWNQSIYNFSFRTNIYYVEQEGRMIYNNLNSWKASAFSYMCFFGIGGFLLLMMYLDQARNISLSNWIWRKRKFED